jgi:hypothetical protein
MKKVSVTAPFFATETLTAPLFNSLFLFFIFNKGLSISVKG